MTIEELFEELGLKINRFNNTLTDCNDLNSYYIINNKRYFPLNSSKVNGQFGTIDYNIKFDGKNKKLSEFTEEESLKFESYLASIIKGSKEFENLMGNIYFKCYCKDNKECTTFYMNGILVNSKYIERWFNYEKIESSLNSHFDKKKNEIINDNSLSSNQKQHKLHVLEIQRKRYNGTATFEELKEWSQEGHNNITVTISISVLNFFKEFRNEINSLFKKQTKFKTMRTFLSKRNVWELIQSHFYYFSYLEDKPTESFINREFLLFKDLVLRILDKGIGTFTEKELSKTRTYRLNEKYNSLYERFYGYFSNLLDYFNEKFDILKYINYFLNYFKLNCKIFLTNKMLRLYKVTKKLEKKLIKQKYDDDFKKLQEEYEKQGWHLCKNGRIMSLDFYKSDRFRRIKVDGVENTRISQAKEWRKQKELNTLVEMAFSM